MNNGSHFLEKTIISIGLKEVFLRTVPETYVGQLIGFTLHDGQQKYGVISSINREVTRVEVQDTQGMQKTDNVFHAGSELQAILSPSLIGTVLNPFGQIEDRFQLPEAETPLETHNVPLRYIPVNPLARESVRFPVFTGRPYLDFFNLLGEGQKLAFFIETGVNEIENLILSAMMGVRVSTPGRVVKIITFTGIRKSNFMNFMNLANQVGALNNAIIIRAYDEDPAGSVQAALLGVTLSKYLARQHGYKVLHFVGDLTSMANNFKEMEMKRGGFPIRRGFPATLYSQIAKICESSYFTGPEEGSLTCIPFLRYPKGEDDFPVLDMTGYITEGQIYFVNNPGITEPADLMRSISRLMPEIAGEGTTSVRHIALANQIISALSSTTSVRQLLKVIELEELDASQRRFLDFGNAVERSFLCAPNTPFTYPQLEVIAMQCLSILEENQLSLLSPELRAEIRTYESRTE